MRLPKSNPSPHGFPAKYHNPFNHDCMSCQHRPMNATHNILQFANCKRLYTPTQTSSRTTQDLQLASSPLHPPNISIQSVTNSLRLRAPTLPPTTVHLHLSRKYIEVVEYLVHSPTVRKPEGPPDGLKQCRVGHEPSHFRTCGTFLCASFCRRRLRGP